MMYVITAIISIVLSAIITTMILVVLIQNEIDKKDSDIRRIIAKNDEYYEAKFQSMGKRLKKLEPETLQDQMSQAFKRLGEAMGKGLARK